MSASYKIIWSDGAKIELDEVFNDVEQYWPSKISIRLALAVQDTVVHNSKNPFLFQATLERPNVRRAVILKLNSLYYVVNTNHTVEIISFYLNRANPNDIKFNR